MHSSDSSQAFTSAPLPRDLPTPTPLPNTDPGPSSDIANEDFKCLFEELFAAASETLNGDSPVHQGAFYDTIRASLGTLREHYDRLPSYDNEVVECSSSFSDSNEL